MGFIQIFFIATISVLSVSLVSAYDPSPLQDICVADQKSKVLVNGVACKNSTKVKADDFSFSGLEKAGNTSNKLGVAVNLINVDKLAGLNTLGLSVARIDYAVDGLNPPHIHPRATETLVVLEGSLYVGFVTTDNRLFSKVIKKGDVFVFPIGLVHFQYNNYSSSAIGLASLSSQNPGTIRAANALFGTKPPISNEILAKALMVDKSTVDKIQSQFM